MKKHLSHLALAGMLLLTACAQPSVNTPGVSEQELKAEQERHQQHVSQTKLEKEQRSKKRRIDHEQRLLRLSQKIAAAALPICRHYARQGDDCVYGFELDKAGSPINAYADGKKIVISPAMMDFASDDNHLAVVLG